MLNGRGTNTGENPSAARICRPDPSGIVLDEKKYCFYAPEETFGIDH